MPRTHRPTRASPLRPRPARRGYSVLSILCVSLACCAVAACLAVRPAVAGTAGQATSPASSEPLREAPAVLAGAKAGAGIGELVVDASFTDLDGKPGHLRDYRGHPTVVCMTSVGCPVAKKYGPTLAEMEERYRDQHHRGVRLRRRPHAGIPRRHRRPIRTWLRPSRPAHPLSGRRG